ncbi:hypothetical protein GIB67_043173 [Kingdonia uniflora]|uniref:RING-type E3 ubiquitin transferase n=1 Tax=Kingdonia uniflora TaxID=39325 RepID=A0A7J7NK26_9MAGN|nr:hypothetical protein GIB67_043173 [Kingdonia uniflora]
MSILVEQFRRVRHDPEFRLRNEEANRARCQTLWDDFLPSLRATYQDDFDQYLRTSAETHAMEQIYIASMEAINKLREQRRNQGLVEIRILDEGEKCSICYEEYEIGDVAKTVKGCSHMFCAMCISNWVTIKRTCPMCRYDMSDNGRAKRRRLRD